jgi:hypothetical protein
MRYGRFAIALSLIAVVAAMGAAPLLGKEARPPKWTRDVLDTFFDDAREKLDGPRPDYGNATPTTDVTAHDSAAAMSDDTRPKWSKLITPETLEAEIKRLNQSLARSLTTPSQFKGGGFKDAGREFSELAVLFAVTAQYEGDVRWKDAAAGLREMFSQAGHSCRAGTDETYRAANAAKQELADVVRGGRPQLPKAEIGVTDWSKVAARPPLMQRLNLGQQERLKNWLSDAATFRKNQSGIAHEAQVMAVLADVIRREAFEFSDDETFVGYADELRQAASDVSAAAEAGDFEKAREAIGRATNACANCHDGYRG